MDKVWDYLPGGGEGGKILFSNFIMLSVFFKSIYAGFSFS